MIRTHCELGRVWLITACMSEITRIDKAVATVCNDILIVNGKINKWLLGLTIFIGGRRAIIIGGRSEYNNYLYRKL